MKSRNYAAVFIALLAVNLLVYAAFAGYALYLTDQVLSLPGSGASDLTDLRGNYTLALCLFLMVALLGGLAATSCFGFIRGKPWAKLIWAVSSALVIGCIVVAVLFFGSPWTHYWFEVSLVLASWWYASRREERANAG